VLRVCKNTSKAHVVHIHTLRLGAQWLVMGWSRAKAHRVCNLFKQDFRLNEEVYTLRELEKQRVPVPSFVFNNGATLQQSLLKKKFTPFGARSCSSLLRNDFKKIVFFLKNICCTSHSFFFISPWHN